MLSEIERRTLKTVVGHAVKTAGGQENAVNVNSRINRPAAFSDYANAALEDRHCPIDVAVELDQFNPEPLILKAMARLAGHAVVRLPAPTSSDMPLGRITGLAMKEIADVFGTLGTQLEDGTLTSAEGPLLSKEIDEAVEMLLTLKVQAQAIAARGGK